MGNMPPRPAAKSPRRREDPDLCGSQEAPRGQPAEGVVEVQFPADMEDMLHERQPRHMVEPGAAVHKRNATHPIRVLIKHEQIERSLKSANEGKANVVKVSRAIEGDSGSIAWFGLKEGRQSTLEAPKA